MKIAIFRPSEITPEQDSIWELQNQGVSKVLIENSTGLCLTEGGRVYDMNLLEVQTKTRIAFAALSNTACLLISFEGATFAMGKDQKNTGILGIRGLNQAKKPILIPDLLDIRSATGSITETHAAIVDFYGNLYTWGSGENGELGSKDLLATHQLPSRVLSATHFKAKKVICSEKFTCICTNGGYIYIYGVLNSAHKRFRDSMDPVLKSFKFSRSNSLSPRKQTGNFPYTLPDLENHFALDMEAGNFLVAVLTEHKSVFVFDDCMDLIKLPVDSKIQIQKIAVCGKRVYGWCQDRFYQWKEPPEQRIGLIQQVACGLCGWVAIEYQVSQTSNFSPCGSGFFGFRCQNTPVFKFFNEIKPYKRSEYAQRLIGSVYDSMDINSPISSPRSPFKLSSRNISVMRNSLIDLQNFEDLQRLYPIGDNQQTIQTIIRCRTEYGWREWLYKAFKPVVYPFLKQIFDKMKEYGNLKWMYRVTYATAFVHSVLGRVKQRTQLISLSNALQKIKSFSQISFSEYRMSFFDKQEGARNITHALAGAVFRITLKSFSSLKDLELQSLQKKTAILTMKEVFVKIFNRMTRGKFGLWRKKTQAEYDKKYSAVQLLKRLKKIVYGRVFFSIRSHFIYQKIKTSTWIRKFYSFHRKLPLNLLKPSFDIWKKLVIQKRVDQLSYNYQLNIGVKCLVLRLNYALMRSQRNAFNKVLQEKYGRNSSFKLGLLILYSILFRSLTRQKASFLKFLFYGSLNSIKKSPQIPNKNLTSNYLLLSLKILNLFDHQKTKTCQHFFYTLKNYKKTSTRRKIKKKQPKSSQKKNTNQKNTEWISFQQSISDFGKKLQVTQSTPLSIQSSCPSSNRPSQSQTSRQQAALEAYQKQLIAKLSKQKHSTPFRTPAPIATERLTPNSSERPPWKPTSVAVNFNSSDQKLNPADRRQEYYSNLKSRMIQNRQEFKLDKSRSLGLLNQNKSVDKVRELLITDRLAVNVLESALCKIRRRRLAEGMAATLHYKKLVELRIKQSYQQGVKKIFRQFTRVGS